MHKYYIIKEIIPKSGGLSKFHASMLGRRSYNIFVEVGSPGWINVDIDDTQDACFGRFHTIRTTRILEMTGRFGSDDTVIIVTKNTKYIFEKEKLE